MDKLLNMEQLYFKLDSWKKMETGGGYTYRLYDIYYKKKDNRYYINQSGFVLLRKAFTPKSFQTLDELEEYYKIHNSIIKKAIVDKSLDSKQAWRKRGKLKYEKVQIFLMKEE